MKRVLFLCTGNSARSQIAEALLRHFGKNKYEVFSAGTQIQREVNPFVIEVLKEKGIDTNGLHPKSLEQFRKKEFDLVITLCDLARTTCPFVPRAKERLHWPLEDPASFKGSYAEILFKFREVRDEIERRIRDEILSRPL